jgi:hypothetical protein
MMRLYSTAPKACIRMVSDSRLHNLLGQLCQSVPITHVLETGTNIGLGSTAFIAEISIGLSRAPQMFVTIEANHWCWRRANKNLIRFPFVTPFWGLSLSLRDALHFVKCDPVLQNHQDYPDIFIDHVENPILFHTRELHGRLGGSTRHRISVVRELVDRYCSYAGENLLSQWLSRFRSQTPLIYWIPLVVSATWNSILCGNKCMTTLIFCFWTIFIISNISRVIEMFAIATGSKCWVRIEIPGGLLPSTGLLTTAGFRMMRLWS